MNSQGGPNEKQKLKDLETVRDLIKKALAGDQNAAAKLHKMMEDQMRDPSEVDGDSPSEAEVAARQYKELDDEKEHLWRAGYGDPDAQRKLQELEYVRDLRKKALAGDQDAIAKLKKLMEEQQKKAKSGDQNAAEQLKDTEAELHKQTTQGDPEANRKLKELSILQDMVQRAANGD